MREPPTRQEPGGVEARRGERSACPCLGFRERALRFEFVALLLTILAATDLQG